jgi:hypothetical protein
MIQISATPLKTFAWAVIAFGAILMLAGFTATHAPVDLLFQLFHPGPGDPVWGQHMRFSTGLMGAVTFGWGMTLLALAQHSPAMGAAAKAVWSSVTIAMTIWFIVDSIISIANGFWVNVVSNVVLGLLYLLATHKSGVWKL